MSCFVGLAVTDELDLNMYEQAISEMEHAVLQGGFSIPKHNNLLIITNTFQNFYLSKNSQYLHSHLQHLIINEGDDEYFLETITECLMILKQYFPSKVEIQLASDLDQIYNIKKMIEQQIPRRLAGNLKMLSDKSKKTCLNKTQIQRLLYCLQEDIHKDYKHKLRTIALKTLSEGKISQEVWDSLEREQIQIIDDLSNDPLYQKLGIEVLEKIVRYTQGNQLIEREEEEQENRDPNVIKSPVLASEIKQKEPVFEGKIDSKTAFFQLKESRNLSRITWIIDNLLESSLTNKQTQKLTRRIQQICKKISKTFYSETSPKSYLKFKTCLHKYLTKHKLSNDSFYQQTLQQIDALIQNL